MSLRRKLLDPHPDNPTASSGWCVRTLATRLREQVTVHRHRFRLVHRARFRRALKGFLNDVNFVTRTPEALSYNNGLVLQFASAAQVLANGLLIVVVLVSGFNIMLRPVPGLDGIWCEGAVATSRPRRHPGEHRRGVGPAGHRREQRRVRRVRCSESGRPRRQPDTHWRRPLTGLVMGLIVVVMGLLLVLQQLMRLALVDVLVVLSPLAALCWTLPQSQAWGHRWGVLFFGTVFAQAVQVLTLHLGFSLATDLPPLSAAGLLLQPLLGIAVLALTLKIPGMMGGSGAGGTFVGDLLGTAAGAAIGTSVGLGVRAALGASTSLRGGGRR